MKETELTFKTTNLGVIAEGKFTQKPLTIFCGPNNSGKTWAMYSLYHFYDTYRRIQHQNYIIRETQQSSLWKAIKSIEKLNQEINSNLSDVFNTEPVSINNARFNLYSSISWKQLEKEINGDTFLMPAERSGLHLVFRELSASRTALLHHASKKDIDLNELLRDVTRSRYAKPIATYIDWLNNLSDSSKSKNNIFHNFALHLQKNLVGGAYKINRITTDITFNPYKKRQDLDIKKPPALGLHLASSTVKSLFSLWFYLEHSAEEGDVLMIDEPELNIHPGNQRKIARLIAQLVNAGLKVVISTHSDYIIRELNTLIMLSNPAAKELRKKHKYKDDEALEHEKVGAYLFDDRAIKPFEISPEDGIYASTFDDVIKDLNKTNDGIYYTLRDLENEN